jgi:hypothetical protein
MVNNMLGKLKKVDLVWQKSFFLKKVKKVLDFK